MARCTIDLSHPQFQAALESLRKKHNDLAEGLEKAKEKIEAEHTACNLVVQPMPGYPDCQGKIWKYD